MAMPEGSSAFNEINKSLDVIEKSITNLQEEVKTGKTSEQAFKEELKRLGEEQLKSAKALAELQQEYDKKAEFGAENAIKSVGELIIENEGFKSFATARHAQFEVSTKAAVTSPAANSISRNTIAAPYQRPGIVSMPEQPLIIESLFPHIPISVPSINYLKEGTYTNNAGITTEGQAHKETTFTTPSLAIANVVNIGHFAKMTQQVIDDDQAFAAYVNTKMIYGLNQKVDYQLINGDGSATQLGGLLKDGNCVVATTDVNKRLPATGATLFDLALAVKAEFETTYLTPEAWLFNPSLWTSLCMIKDAQGRYILGGPQSVASKSLWGIPVVTSATVPDGKYILGNYTMGATIYDRQNLLVQMTDSDADDFKSQIITVRVTRRLAFAVENPKAIYADNFTLPKA